MTSMRLLLALGAAFGGGLALLRVSRREPVALRDKVVIVTGASSGIGKTAARAFAREDARVVLVARRAEPLREVAAELETCASPALIVPTDVTCDDQLHALVETVLRAFGRIDVLVNNAGLACGGYHQDIDPARLRRLVATNVYAPMRLAQLVLPVMLRQRSGHIVNISSMAGYIPAPGQAAYCATRAALLSFSAALRRETAGTGVHVCAVMPTFVTTPMTRAVSERAVRASGALWPVERFDPPEVVAAAIVDAVRYHRREVPMGGLEMRLAAAGAWLTAWIMDQYWRGIARTPDYVAAISRLGEGL